MNIRQYLPSKKFQYIVGGTLLVAVVVFGGTKLFSSKNNYKKEQVADATPVLLGSMVYVDTDGDGLLDWEEALWGTDPLLPDTDGDGVTDKQYVDTLRPADNGDGESATVTGSFTRELLSSLIALNQAGNLSEENLREIGETLADNIEQGGLFEAYSIDDLTLVAVSDTAGQAYKKNIAAVFKQYTSSPLGEELAIFPLFLNNPSEHQQDLEEIITLYRELGAKLDIKEVPQNIAVAHLSLMNNLNRVALGIEELLFLKEDPLRGVAGLSYYEKYSLQLERSFQIINSYVSLYK